MDFEKARFNMVEQQIRPWNVLDFTLLDVLQEVPREIFLEEKYHSFAYADMNLPLPNGAQILEPKIIARLIQALDLQKTDTVLEIGTGAGYATAILAKMAKHVTTVDIDQTQQQRAAKALEKMGVDNVTFQTADGFDEQLFQDKTFDAIYIGGGVNSIPPNLRACMADNGYLVAVVGPKLLMHAVILHKKDDVFTHRSLFETSIPHLIQGKRTLNEDVFVF